MQRAGGGSGQWHGGSWISPGTREIPLLIPTRVTLFHQNWLLGNKTHGSAQGTGLESWQEDKPDPSIFTDA
jgi:hypothetical protein